MTPLAIAALVTELFASFVDVTAPLPMLPGVTLAHAASGRIAASSEHEAELQGVD